MCFPKLLSPCDLPGTFWLPENPHFGPLAIKMGLYVINSVICVGQKSVWFFHEIKDTFFIFTNNFVDLGILSKLAISCVV